VEPHLAQLRDLAAHSPRTARPGRARPPRTSIPAHPRRDRDAPQPTSSPAPAVASSEPPRLRDRGLTLLTIFTTATLLIVALVCLVGGVDRWWILIPVMAVDLAATGVVLAAMVRLLDDGSET
jgi:hypothetical protein